MNIYNSKAVESYEELINNNIFGYKSTNEGRLEFKKNIITFDSETQQVGDYSTPVCFQIAINDKCMLVRTYEEIINIFDRILEDFTAPAKQIKVKEPLPNGKMSYTLKKVEQKIFVHNLSYDIYFFLDKIKSDITNTTCFKSKISKVEYKNRLTFQDTLGLTGMSLAESAKEYLGNDILKSDGWDYSKIRSPFTTLTDEEVFYALADVVVLKNVVEKIADLRNQEVTDLELSNTMYVIRNLKDACQDEKYRALMKKLVIPDVDALDVFIASYSGGVSDVSPLYVNKWVENISDFDIASEYPTAMATELFPMTAPVRCNFYEDFKTLEDLMNFKRSKYGLIGFTVRFKAKNVKVKPGIPLPIGMIVGDAERIIQQRKGNIDIKVSGNRLYAADEIVLSYNCIDLEIFMLQYDFELVEVLDLFAYGMHRLPKNIIELILEGYNIKTSFKDVPGYEKQYILAKETLNTIYGLNARNILKPDYDLNDDNYVTIKEKDERLFKQERLNKYNDSHFYRNTSFLWGIYAASYGHQYLYAGMTVLKNDVVACDTDSIKFITTDDNLKKMELINEIMMNKLKFASKDLNIPIEKFMPKTPKGEIKPLGQWENDGVKGDFELVAICSKRAKCYIKKYINKNTGEVKYDATVAGIAPNNLIKGLQHFVNKKCYTNIEEAFLDELIIPAELTGNMICRYNNNQSKKTYIDCQGNKFTMKNKTGVTLHPLEFSLNDKVTDMDIIDFVLFK